MTDGIIQQIFDELDTLLISKYGENHNVRFDVIKKKQELIEKIKQYHFDDDRYFDDTIKKVLIGDNQE